MYIIYLNKYIKNIYINISRNFSFCAHRTATFERFCKIRKNSLSKRCQNPGNKATQLTCLQIGEIS